MNRRLILFIPILFLMLLAGALQAAVAYAIAEPPPLPHSFYGSVQINSANVPLGTQVTAAINGVPYVTTTTFMAEGKSVYKLDVPADHPDTSGTIEGGVNGDTITFRIGVTNTVQTALWSFGQFSRLDLALFPQPVPPLAQFDYEPFPLFVSMAVQFIDQSVDPDGTISAWGWDFGDGVHSSLSGPTHTYSVAGIYTPTLTVTDSAGMTDTFSAQLHVYGAPTANFSFSPTLLSYDQLVHFSDLSSDSDGSIATRFWDFGDGVGDSAPNPTHTYPIGGVYTVTLYITDNDGLQGIARQTLTVHAPPQANFITDKDLNVAAWEDGANVLAFSSVYDSNPGNRPENAVDNNIYSNWVTGNNQNTNQSLTVQLAGSHSQIIERIVLRGTNGSDGIKNFRLRVSSTGTNPGDFTTILEGVVPADFNPHEYSFAPVEARYVQLVALNGWGSPYIRVYQFEVHSRDRQGGVVSLLEGPQAKIVAVSSTYPGYTADSLIDNNDGSVWFSVSQANSNQWVKIDLAGKIRTISRIQFRTGYPGEGMKDFEILVSTTSPDDAAFHSVYSGTGVDTTNLQEYSFAPVQARYVKLLMKTNQGSPNYFRVDTLRFFSPEGQNVSRLEGVGGYVIAASSYNPSYPPEQAIDFNIGSYFLTAYNQPANQWLKVGLLDGESHRVNTIRLRGSGGSASLQHFRLSVSNQSTADADFQVVLEAQLPPNSDFHWFTFPPVDAKYVKLDLIDNYNYPYIEFLDFQVYASDLGGARVPFHDLSTDGDGGISGWRWDFGDGSRASIQHPVHTYAAPGVYTVTLTVTDTDGITRSDSLPYRVGSAPVVDFATTPITPTENQGTSLNGVATDADGLIVNYLWKFPHTDYQPNSASTSTAFPDNGSYVVYLTATDSQLLSTVVSKTINVLNVPPTVDIGPDLLIRRTNEELAIYGYDAYRNVGDASGVDSNNLTYLWATGDGRTFTTPAVNFSYPTAGTYTVTLTVKDPQNATATDALAVRVYNDAIAPSSSMEFAGSRNSALLENTNIPSLLGAGATIVNFSDRYNYDHGPQDLLSLETTTGLPWAVPTNHPNYVTIMLAGGNTYEIDRVRVRPRADGCCPTQHVKDFEVWVSTTTPRDSDFVRVLTAQAADNGNLQEFLLPGGAVQAKYVKYVPLNSREQCCYISTSQFQVVATSTMGPGGVVSASSQQNADSGPERALDQDAGSFWRSSGNQNQSLKVLLAGGAVQTIHAVSLQPTGNAQSIRNFAIQVSTTDDEDASFTTIYSGTVQNGSQLQDFFFPPVAAKYVKLLAIDNYGDGCCISVAEFQVHTTVPLDADGWYHSKVMVTLPAQDNPGGSGVQKIEYSLNSGNNWTTYSGPFFYSAQGSVPFWVRATDMARNVETPKKGMLLVDPTPKPTRTEAGQAGIDWLSTSANLKSANLQCVACHVQGDALHGLALGGSTGYDVNVVDVHALVNFMTETRFQRPSDGLWPHPPGGADFVTMNTSHSLFGLAMYDRFVSTDKSSNLVSGVNGMLGRQQADGRWASDHSIAPTNEGDIEPTTHMVFALRQAKEHVDPATAALYQASLDRALAWLKTASLTPFGSPVYTQDETLKLIGLIEGGVAKSDPLVTALVDRLRSEQFQDGGWRENTNFTWTSAFATGESLYALCAAGVSRFDPQVIKGLDWLIHEQGNYDRDIFYNGFVLDGPWLLRNTSAAAPFASTMWPVIALGCFGEVSFELSAAPTAQQLTAGLEISQTASYTVTVKNTGAEADTYDLALSGGAEGWRASLNSSSVHLEVGETKILSLTVLAPAHLPNDQIVLYSIIASSHKNDEVSRLGLVTSSTAVIPTSGHATQTMLTAGNGESHPINTTIRLAATVQDSTSSAYVQGPGAGVVNFLVGGIAVGSDNDADGDGIFTINWTPNRHWPKLNLQDLRAIYSGSDQDEPAADLLSSFAADSITIESAVTLRVTKSDGLVAVQPGQRITYTLTISNEGNLDASGVLITDTLPTATTFISSTGGTYLPGASAQVVWATGVVTVEQVVTQQVVVQMNSLLPLPDVITNSVTVGDDGGHSASKQDVDSVTKAPQLTLVKSDGISRTVPGAVLTYTLTLHNAGYGAATNVQLVDQLPQNTQALAAGNGGVMANNSVTWSIPTVAAQSLLTRTVRLQVAAALPAGAETLTNTATVQATGIATVTAQDVDNLVAAPALSIHKSDGHTSIVPGERITYTVTITNVGNQAAINLVITDTLPASTTLVAASHNAVSSSTGVTWTLAGLNAGATVTRSVSLRLVSDIPAQLKAITNTVTARAAEVDAVQAQDVDNVIAAPILYLYKDDGRSQMQPGDLLTYTLSIANTGNVVATDVVLTDVLPLHTQYVSANAGGTLTQGVVRWEIGDLAVQAAMSRTVTVQVDNALPSGVETITNTATLRAENVESVSSQDVDSVSAAPDLHLSKSDGRSLVQPGALLTYTLVVSNTGNQAAAAVKITDTLPLSVTFVAANAGGVQQDSQVVWTVGALGVGERVTRTVSVRVATAFPNAQTGITNTAQVLDATAGESSRNDNVATDYTAVNHAPLAVDDSFNVAEDSAGNALAVLNNDDDLEADGLAIQAVSAAAHGAILHDSQVVSYTPAPNFSGSDSFTYTVSDGVLTSMAWVTVTVTPANDAPQANALNLQLDEETTLSVTLTGTDIDLDGLTYSVVTTPTHGALSGTAPNLRYTPATNYHGADSFTFRANDGQLNSAPATVALTIRPVNDAPSAANDTATTNEDVAVTVTVLANDGDVDGDSLTLVSAGAAVHGATTLQGTKISYDPADNYHGPDSFSYVISDGVLTATASVSVTVAAVNDAPQAVADSFGLAEDSVANVLNVLTNDSDVDGDLLHVASATQPTHGTTALTLDGRLLYTPTDGYAGPDSFSYTVSDGDLTSITTVSITVSAINHAPVALDDEFSVQQESTGNLLVVLANDSDVDNDSLTVAQVAQPQHGDATIQVSGTLVYTPDLAFSGAESFAYVISDGHGLTATATVTVTVNHINHQPIARDDTATTTEEGAVTVTVLANDSDVDGDVVSMSAVSVPSHGSATPINGALRYTPTLNYVGSDTLIYSVSDGHGLTATATVTITVTPVNDAPAASAQTVALDEDTSLPVTLTGSDLDGDALTFKVVTSLSHGDLSGTAPTLTYTPDENYHGDDSFTFVANDGTTDSAPATIAITVRSVNDAPQAQNDSAGTDEDAAVSVDALVNDSDVDGDALAITATSQPAHGTVVMSATSITYTPASGYAGSDSLIYIVSDGALTSTATINLTVAAINHAPQAVDDVATTPQGASVVIAVLSNDQDPDDDALSVDSLTQPIHGAVKHNDDNTVTYTPAAGYTGSDSFTYVAWDGALGNTATVRLTVTAPVKTNHAPLAMDDSVTVAEDSAGNSVAVLGNDSDEDSDALQISAFTQPAHGTVTLDGEHGILYTPAANYFGEDSFVYTISDGALTATAQVAVTVEAVNDAPVAMDDHFVVDEDSQENALAVLANDSDLEGNALNIAAVTTPIHGAATVTADGQLLYTPASGFVGSESFAYTLSDGDLTSTATVTVSVGAVDHAPTAVDDSVTLRANSQQNKINVLTNDADVDGDSLIISAVGAAAHGTVVISQGTSVLYTPAADYSGADSFSYTVSDGLLSAEATVAIEILAPPVIACDLYPLALASSSIVHAQVGDTVADMSNGTQPGNFGWLSWTGEDDPATLVESLTPSGDSQGYVNPDAAGDHLLSVGDWLFATPDVGNDTSLESALAALKTQDMIVPLWDQSRSQAGATHYHVAGFARVRLLDYQLGDPSQISVRFLGYAQCGDKLTDDLPTEVTGDLLFAYDDAYVVAANSAITVAVLANDVVAAGATFAVTAAGDPAHGVATVLPDNRIVYQPSANFSGLDSFEYTVQSSNGMTATATVVMVVVDEAPAPPAHSLFLPVVADNAGSAAQAADPATRSTRLLLPLLGMSIARP